MTIKKELIKVRNRLKRYNHTQQENKENNPSKLAPAETLSDKIFRECECNNPKCVFGNDLLFKEDVKQFIKDLKKM